MDAKFYSDLMSVAQKQDSFEAFPNIISIILFHMTKQSNRRCKAYLWDKTFCTTTNKQSNNLSKTPLPRNKVLSEIRKLQNSTNLHMRKFTFRYFTMWLTISIAASRSFLLSYRYLSSVIMKQIVELCARWEDLPLRKSILQDYKDSIKIILAENKAASRHISANASFILAPFIQEFLTRTYRSLKYYMIPINSSKTVSGSLCAWFLVTFTMVLLLSDIVASMIAQKV